MFLKTFILAFVALFSVNTFSQEKYTVMFYNLLEFPDAPPLNRSAILKTIVDDVSPDLFMVCELKSENGAKSILEESLATNDDRYAMANYISNRSSGANLQQSVYYNTNKLELERQSEIITSVRDINHYTFKLKNTDIFIETFVAHLKASQGFTNEQIRLDMVREFTLELARIPKDSYVLFAGDFNFYTSNEDGYQEILDNTNAIILKDPLDISGNWHTNSVFSSVHTQSTRTSSSPFDGFGAGGGLDDRFDFIMISENLTEQSTLQYVEESYKTIGNNGNCYNRNINDSRCTGPYSQTLRNALYTMSDHLPVTLELVLDSVLSVTTQNTSEEMVYLTSGNVIKNRLTLKVDDRALNQSLIIYNNLGQQIKKINIVDAMIHGEITIDATDLALGIYYLAIKNTTTSSPLKFIKIN